MASSEDQTQQTTSRRSPTWRDKAEYFLFKAASSFLRVLPLELASTLSGLLWEKIAPHTHRHKRALNHLCAAIPGQPDEWYEQTTRTMWNNLGRVTAESLNLEIFSAQPERIEISTSQRDKIEQAASRGKGIVFVTLHMGNWELAALVVQREGLSFAGIYQKARNPLIDALITSKRTPYYQGGLLEKGNISALKAFKHVRRGGALGILADLRDRRGVNVPFFHKDAPSTTFPAMVARQTGATLLVGCIRRTDGSSFTCELEEIEYSQSENIEDDVTIATAQIQNIFEVWIRKNPQQWMWAHRRWG
jgi:Kdo2-lipid IVA lauroyltransferase/acyltransferase